MRREKELAADAAAKRRRVLLARQEADYELLEKEYEFWLRACFQEHAQQILVERQRGSSLLRTRKDAEAPSAAIVAHFLETLRSGSGVSPSSLASVVAVGGVDGSAAMARTRSTWRPVATLFCVLANWPQ